MYDGVIITYDLCDVIFTFSGYHVIFIYDTVLADPTAVYTYVRHHVQ